MVGALAHFIQMVENSINVFVSFFIEKPTAPSTKPVGKFII